MRNLVTPSTRTIHLSMSGFFLFLYVSYGAFYPLLSLYLQELKLTGTQMGIIMSVGSLMMLFVQPLWGIFCDYTKRLHLTLGATLFISAIIAYFFTQSTSFTVLLTIAIMLAFFQSAVNPISDSIVMNYVSRNQLDYGRFRMWGALGFALSAWIVGLLSKKYGLELIFYTYAVFFLLAMITVWWLPREQVKMKRSMTKGLKKLFRIPRFFLFLLAVFCIIGPMLSNNSFFGPYFQSIGGTVAGVGFCFFIGAGSEVPFMKWAANWVKRYGILLMCICAGIVSASQYLIFTFEPPVNWLYFISLSQGFSIGIFIPASLQYVQQLAPIEVQTTAIATYSGAGYGLGNWFFVFMGGILMDHFDVVSIYLFYGGFSLLGVALLLCIFVSDRKKQPRRASIG